MVSEPRKVEAIGQFMFDEDSTILLFAENADIDWSKSKEVNIIIQDYQDDGNEEDFTLPVLGKGHLIYLLQEIMAREELDEKKSSDFDYLWTKIKDNLGIIEEMSVIAEPHSDFRKAAEFAFEAGMLEAAIVLIATAVEQYLNIFYRYALEDRDSLSTDEITDVIRNTTIKAKTGWLMSIVTGQSMSTELHDRVMDLAELRNQIVHFKAVPTKNLRDKTSGSHNVIKQRICDLDFRILLSLQEELYKERNTVLEALWCRLPNYTPAQEIADFLTEQLRAGRVIKNSITMKRLG